MLNNRALETVPCSVYFRILYSRIYHHPAVDVVANESKPIQQDLRTRTCLDSLPGLQLVREARARTAARDTLPQKPSTFHRDCMEPVSVRLIACVRLEHISYQSTRFQEHTVDSVDSVDSGKLVGLPERFITQQTNCFFKEIHVY